MRWAAGGSAFTLMTFLTSIILGLCMGSGALFSMRFGQRDEQALRENLCAAFVFIALITVLLNALAFVCLNGLRMFLQVPAEVWGDMREYLFVIFMGIPAVFLYNYFASFLRAIGNSVIPLIFLAFSAVLNIALDLWFVIGLDRGVAGAAEATVSRPVSIWHRHCRLAEQIKEKSKERKTLLAEKKATPIIQIPKHRELSRRIAELTEELEELRAEKALLLQSLQYDENTGVDVIRKDISTMEAGLKRLEQQEQEYTVELEDALKEYAELKGQVTEFDLDKLMNERLAIRPGKERSAVARVQSAYGDRYQPLMMCDSKRDVSEMLGEETEARSIRERLRQKRQPQTQRQKKSKRE